MDEIALTSVSFACYGPFKQDAASVAIAVRWSLSLEVEAFCAVDTVFTMKSQGRAAIVRQQCQRLHQQKQSGTRESGRTLGAHAVLALPPNW